ncbi:hypothetical protein QCA50_010331 [Cerrena zonata]|uniref:Nop52-domain-containing protein n=1 Tax=Cerrena zonata TaxID=2478898 RepID=A0AAW0GAU3_9APHY
MATQSGTPPLGKFLASTDKKTRDKAIKGLATFLSDPSKDELPKLEMAKLWKGIFYCFWMSDKPLVQQALASEIAEILLSITSNTASLGFLRGFWEAIVREWSGIDRLRIDKYYMLVRRFINASFRVLMRAEWDETLVNEYTSIMTSRGGPLCAEDTRVPSSLTYHLADIYLEELNKALANPPTPSSLPAPLSSLLSPYFNLAARTPSNVTYQRIQSALIDPLFAALSTEGESNAGASNQKRSKPTASDNTYPNIIENSCGTDPKEGPLDKVSLRKVLLARLFDIASEQDTRDSNRRKLYAVWKTYVDDEVDEHPLDAS